MLGLILGFLFSVAVLPMPPVSATLQGGSQLLPAQVVERFCEMNSQGKQLTEEGWREMAGLFSHPGTPPSKKVIVVKDFVVSRPAISGNQAELYVEYIYVGQIDSAQGRFSSLPYIKVRSGFDLSRTDNNSEWRISVAPPESHITIAAALQYMRDLHDHTADANTKRNAKAAIVSLRHIQ